MIVAEIVLDTSSPRPGGLNSRSRRRPTEIGPKRTGDRGGGMTSRDQPIQCIGCPVGCGGEADVEDGAVVETRGLTCDVGEPTPPKKSSRRSGWSRRPFASTAALCPCCRSFPSGRSRKADPRLLASGASRHSRRADRGRQCRAGERARPRRQFRRRPRLRALRQPGVDPGGLDPGQRRGGHARSGRRRRRDGGHSPTTPPRRGAIRRCRSASGWRWRPASRWRRA